MCLCKWYDIYCWISIVVFITSCIHGYGMVRNIIVIIMFLEFKFVIALFYIWACKKQNDYMCV